MPMRAAALALLLAAAVPPQALAQATSELKIGLAAPLSEANAVLGAQVLAGGREAAAKNASIRLTEADTRCSAEGGRAAAETFVAAKVAVAVGFLCTASLEAALPVLSAAGVPTLDVGVRANRFTDRRTRAGWLIWRIAPRSDAEAEAAASLILSRWRNVPFALLDDGSIHGRGLADALRARLETEGVKPAAVDNYRPAEEKQFGLVRRLERTGITHVFIAGDRPDAATIARDAASNGLRLEIMGGETLLDEPSDTATLPVGTLAVAPRQRFPQSGAATDAAREGYFGPALAATEIAAEAVRTAQEAGRPLAQVLSDTTFVTKLGPVRFDANGDSDLDLFRTFVFDGTDFREEPQPLPDTAG